MTRPRPPFRKPAGPAEDREDSYDRRAREREAPETLPRTPACPFCEGTETEIMSAFGSHASVSTYWCRACRSPFELMKWR